MSNNFYQAGPGIPIFPTLRNAGNGSTDEPKLFPFSTDRTSYWINARTALWQGLKILGLKPGDRVLAPVYACGSEIDVLIKYGLVLDWYAINSDLTVDLNHAEANCKVDTKAFFFIHYFGIPQPLQKIRRFCDAKKLLCIEDNAHGLFSTSTDKHPLGSFGDIAIFSIYKFFPVPDGGALIVNLNSDKKHLKPERQLVIPMLGRVKLVIDRYIDHSNSSALRFVRNNFINRLLTAIKRRKFDAPSIQRDGASSHLVSKSSHHFDLKAKNQGMSWIASCMLKFFKQKTIVEIRRKNFIAMLQGIVKNGDAAPLVDEISEGYCPLFFPLKLNSPNPPFREFMRKNEIECHGFGFFSEAMPADGFPVENELKKQIVCLPVHQSLTASEVNTIIAKVNQWNLSHTELVG